MSRVEARGEELLRTLDLVREALRGLRFGTIELQVHDAQVVRVTRTEKVRVEPAREVRELRDDVNANGRRHKELP